MKTRLYVIIILMSLFLLPVTSAFADEINDQINEGAKLYKEGKYSQAASELEFAVQQIREKQAENLKNALPAPLTGWKAKEAESQAVAAAILGGGINISRLYKKESAAKKSDPASPNYEGEEGDSYENPSVQIEIVSESPMIQGMLALFSNPAMISSQGGKIVKVKGYRGSLRKEGGDSQIELTLVVANKVLVTVRGENGATDADVMAYGNAINFSLLEGATAK